VFGRRDRPELTRVDLADLLWDTTRLLRRVVPESIELQTYVEKKLPSILADPAGLEQVLLNLATNARDAMPEGGKLRLTAELATLAQADVDTLDWGRPGPCICITIADDGHGMAPEVLDKIYDPFFTTKPVGSGTGLGMSIVYGVVQQHGAHIRLDSAPGRGTRVELRFSPLVNELPLEDAADTGEVPGGSETILLVEDNE